jgi:hypothetical protein
MKRKKRKKRKKMNRYFAINGYWKDDKSTIDGYIVTSMDDPMRSGEEEDDEIFFYFASAEELDEMIARGEDTGEEFVITHYEEITELYENCK